MSRDEDEGPKSQGLNEDASTEPSTQPALRIHTGPLNLPSSGTTRLSVANSPFGDVVVFVGSALGSGIIGNAAYDALKETVKKRVARSRSGIPFVGHERELLARAAVRARCEEIGFPVPDLDGRCHVQWNASETGYVYNVVFPDVVAQVAIPRGPLDGRQLQVIVRTHADRYETVRALARIEERRR